MRFIRTTFLLGALTLFLMLVGQYVGGRNGTTLGLGIAICTNAFAYFFSDKIALLSSGARPVSQEELPRLYAVMERLAAKANLPVPKLYVIPEAAPNAFATGRSPRHASVAVTEGLLVPSRRPLPEPSPGLRTGVRGSGAEAAMTEIGVAARGSSGYFYFFWRLLAPCCCNSVSRASGSFLPTKRGLGWWASHMV